MINSYDRRLPKISPQGVRIEAGLRLDLLVEKSIILELKAVDKLLPIHKSQLLTYLKLSDFRLGLFINLLHICPVDFRIKSVGY